MIMPVIIDNWEILCVNIYLDDVFFRLRDLHTGLRVDLLICNAPVGALNNLSSLFC